VAETRGWRGMRRWAITVSKLIVLLALLEVGVVLAVVVAFGVLIELVEEVRADGVKMGEEALKDCGKGGLIRRRGGEREGRWFWLDIVY
jgi:hypothetical protein